ncbi:MAG: hypothetical protein HXS48_25510 [Theionarchaea archaeon]|nr:hypothetical protein [Theionarchaea archaeon]
MNSPEDTYMAHFNSKSGDFSIQRFHCRGEHTYERGKPLEISTSIEIDHTMTGEATVRIEVFRKRFWSYERIYSKVVQIALKETSEQTEYTLCIPGYETEEFQREQQLKMKVDITFNGESVFKEASWKVLESS